MTQEKYMDKARSNGTTMNHFPEKLLKLKDMMKTQTGQAMAEARHNYVSANPRCSYGRTLPVLGCAGLT